MKNLLLLKVQYGLVAGLGSSGIQFMKHHLGIVELRAIALINCSSTQSREDANHISNHYGRDGDFVVVLE